MRPRPEGTRQGSRVSRGRAAAFEDPAPRVRFAKATSDSITGASTSTPTTVARAAPEPRPKRLIATATASSKKLDVPINAHGAATSKGIRQARATRQAMKKIPQDSTRSGPAISRIASGLSTICGAWNPNSSLAVAGRPSTVAALILSRKASAAPSPPPRATRTRRATRPASSGITTWRPTERSSVSHGTSMSARRPGCARAASFRYAGANP